MKQHVIFDLDGTLADNSHRLWRLAKDPIDWDAFHLAAEHDTPIPELVDIARGLSSIGKQIHILTGRSEIARDLTINWLIKHGVPFDSLCMRFASDHTADSELKPKLLRSLGIVPEDVYLAFEDRTRMATVWRDMGIRTLQVANGDF